MKIAFDAKRAFHNQRGLGNYSRNLIANQVHFFPEENYYLFSPKAKDYELINWGKSLSAVHLLENQFVPGTLWRTFGVGRELRHHKIDLFHGLSHELPYFIPEKTKKVVTIHDLIYLRFPHFFPWIDRRIYDQKFRRSCQLADKIVAIGEQTKNDLIDFFKIKEERIEVCYQSCLPIHYLPVNEDQKRIFKSKYNLNNPFVLSVGALEERKNFKELIHSFHLIYQQTDLNLVIVGRGHLEKELRQLIQTLNLQDRVAIKTEIPTVDMPILYSVAQSFIFVSSFEGFGIPILEAQLKNLPIAVAKHSSLVEVASPEAIMIEENRVDFIADALLKLSSTHTIDIERQNIFLEKFSPYQTALKMHELYLSLI